MEFSHIDHTRKVNSRYKINYFFPRTVDLLTLTISNDQSSSRSKQSLKKKKYQARINPTRLNEDKRLSIERNHRNHR